MQIIFVSSHLDNVRTIHLKPRHIIAISAILLLLVMATSFVFSWFSIQQRLPVVQDLLRGIYHQERQEAQQFVNDNFQALAVQLGELKAKVAYLDDLGQKLSTKTGVSLEEKPAEKQRPPQGGPFVPAPSIGLREEIERLSAQVEEQSRLFDQISFVVRKNMVQQILLPTTMPLEGEWRMGSPFGLRSDPFGRGRAMHEGIDFVSAYGTPVHAAADGIVVYAAYHSEFGNLLEVNHGGKLITRYAHLSAMNVSSGSVVRRGQKIGELGNTGRSTGPHLHFEIRENGEAINPEPFLKSADNRQRWVRTFSGTGE